MLRTFLLSCSLLISVMIQATTTYQYNGTTSQTTFAGNNLSAHASYENEQRTILFAGRNDASLPSSDPLAPYALSMFIEGDLTVYPFAPAQATLNGLQDQPNPLCGQQISLMGIFNQNPVVVTTQNPQNLYWSQGVLGLALPNVLSCENVLDATGAVTSGIVSLAGALVRAATTVVKISGNYIFTVVGANGGVFGAPGSGVALVQQFTTALTQVAAQVGQTAVQAVPLDGTQSYVAITAPATISTTPSGSTFDYVLQRFYTVFEATSGAGASDGSRGIVMGYMNPFNVTNPDGSISANPRLILTDFAPASAYTGSSQVGGVVGSNAVVNYSQIKTVLTSTGLTYAIVVGTTDSGIFPANRTVSALPLVNKSADPTNVTWPTDPTHGALASKIINPGINLVDYYNPAFKCQPFVARGFQIPVTTTADLPLQSDPQVLVGGSTTPYDILDFQVFKDTVFVAVAASGSEAGGVFYSQALFDENAAIKAWTPWQRFSSAWQPGTTIFGITYQPMIGKMFELVGQSSDTINTVATTTWGNSDSDGLLGGTLTDPAVGFIDEVGNQFSVTTSGIQYAFDFPSNTDGFEAQQFSAMIFTGYQQITLVQTSSVVGGVLTPTIGDFSTNMQNSTTGAVTTPGVGTLIISITGGALESLGALTSATIVNSGAGSWYLVVGGVGGIAVLQPGWTVPLTGNFVNLPASAFTLVGSYKNVRKLLNDGSNLYVLTNTTLDRISGSQLGGAIITPVTVASPATLSYGPYLNFSDAAVSAKVALLATSQGLLATGPGGDVSTATTPAGVNWTHIVLPESQGVASRLFPLSTTGLLQDFSGPADSQGGQVYVVAGSISQQLTSIYRFSIQQTRNAPVTSTTVQLVPDYFVEAHPSGYAAYGAYRNYVYTNGALVTDSRARYVTEPFVFEALPSNMRTGIPLAPLRSPKIALTDKAPISMLGLVVRNSGVGSLLLPTNSGLRVLE